MTVTVPVVGGTVNWTVCPTDRVPKDCTDPAGCFVGRTGFWQPTGATDGPISPPPTMTGAGQEIPGCWGTQLPALHE